MQTTCLVRTHLFNRWTNVRFDQRHQSPLVLSIVHGSWYGCHWIPCRLDTNRRTILILVAHWSEAYESDIEFGTGFRGCFQLLWFDFGKNIAHNELQCQCASINFNVHTKPKNQMNWSKALNIRRIRLCTIVLVWTYVLLSNMCFRFPWSWSWVSKNDLSAT